MEAIGRRHRGDRIAALTERVTVIVNPASGGGRGAKMLPAVREAFAAQGVTDILITSQSSDERRLALDSISAGSTTIVCIGGDGTCGNVANAILQSGTDTRLGLIPAGTGNDFARNLGLAATDIREVARRSVITSNTRMDVGRIEDNCFLNSCGFGFDVAVLHGLPRTRWLGNRLVYMYSAVKEILGFRGVEMSVQSPAMTRDRLLYLIVVFANGSQFGGGITIAPSATVTDGELDGVLIREATGMRRLRMLAAAARGTHTRFDEVAVERAPRFTLTFDAAPLYQSDGELHQAKDREVTVECLPAALRVLTS
jgi:diacylglycerol kinase (ATP)